MNVATKINKPPHLPGLFAIPFKFAPAKLHSQLLVVLLNRILSQQLAEGDINFLENRCLIIEVQDVGIRYSMELSNGKLVSVPAGKTSDLLIRACVYDFLMLAARQEDPDTLVFQRRLIMEGDTELGLELKNFIDGLDIESTGSLSFIDSILHKGLPVYRRMFS